MNQKRVSAIFVLVLVFFVTTGFSLFGKRDKKEDKPKSVESRQTAASSSEAASGETEADEEKETKTLPLAEVKRIREQLEEIRGIERQVQPVKIPSPSVDIPPVRVQPVEVTKIETRVAVKPVVVPELPKPPVVSPKDITVPPPHVTLPPTVKEALNLQKQSLGKRIPAASEGALQKAKKAQQ